MDIFDLREPASALSHGAWLLVVTPGVALLWKRGQGDRSRQLSLLVYGLSLIACFAASSAYHGLHGPPEYVTWLGRLDHVGIYTLIAGTYTPIAWNLLRDPWRQRTLTVVWLAVVLGATMQATIGALPTAVSTCLYLGLGWGAVLFYSEIALAVPAGQARPILIGGVIYSVGAALNLLHWPVLWPGVFESHDLFHLIVMAASLVHFSFIFDVVATRSATEYSPTDSEVPQPLFRPHRRPSAASRLPVRR